MTVVATKGVNTSFEPFPAGDYKAQLVKYEEFKAKKSGQKAFKTTWVITEPEEYAGRKTFINGSLQSQALFGIKRIGIALGVPDDILEAAEGWDPEEVLPEYYEDAEVTLRIKDSEYNGKPSNDVDVLLPGESTASSWD